MSACTSTCVLASKRRYVWLFLNIQNVRADPSSSNLGHILSAFHCGGVRWRTFHRVPSRKSKTWKKWFRLICSKHLKRFILSIYTNKWRCMTFPRRAAIYYRMPWPSDVCLIVSKNRNPPSEKEKESLYATACGTWTMSFLCSIFVLLC